ncbi:AbrB family transcriptional regulator [Siculibacillus lacustris]|uniref:AbrB family transcriptional regulator n=1 Tax=Siculibacillus lacustris TaxID=1549641 RepID=A0A4Q9VUI2_9HYPH|nr:AbrB family transcriptional regulator [Siculibacillus lacustris]TBW38688.1 AbrB family transcriptional regulator [Siculibacillus lacustris]
MSESRGPGRAALQWAGLVGLSALVATLLEEAHLPAAFMLGPLISGLVVRLSGFELRVPRIAYLMAQCVIGGMIGAVLTPAIIHTFTSEWPLLLATVGAVVAVSSLSGWGLSRGGIVPGTTGVWGSSPGAASAMVILAEANGADARLVAFMQYLRVLFVASAASVVAAIWIGDMARTPFVLFPLPHWPLLATTVAVVGGCGALGILSRVPSGAMLAPMFGTAILHGTGMANFELPPSLLILAYAMLGWTIGLGFTRAALGHAWHALPWIVASIVVLMVFCGGLSVVLVHFLGIDPLTAYLATSPGGLDTVAIIAASTPVDVGFVMAMQAVRFFVLILIGPSLSRWVAAHIGRA